MTHIQPARAWPLSGARAKLGDLVRHAADRSGGTPLLLTRHRTVSDLNRCPLDPYHLPDDRGLPVAAPALAVEAGPMTALERLPRAVTRDGSALPEAAWSLTTTRHSERLDPDRAVTVDQADPALLCWVGGCRMRAWPPRTGTEN
ncbi:hypothetical protein AB0J63_49605 [Streptosporangium canum]|uniref:hypothetical protein n=1 Tax=Streptosporangium canum TaxID=324952 RepID=UPI00341E0F0F